jgi:hypothetical protein
MYATFPSYLNSRNVLFLIALAEQHKLWRFLLRSSLRSPGSQDSVVARSLVTGYGLDDRGFGIRVAVGSRIFSSQPGPVRLWDPPNLLYNGRAPGALSSMVERPGPEANHSPPPGAQVKKIWIYKFTPHTPSWRSA